MNGNYERKFKLVTSNWIEKFITLEDYSEENIFIFADGGMGKTYYSKEILFKENGYSQIDINDYSTFKPKSYFDGWDEISSIDRKKILKYISSNNIKGLIILGRDEGIIPSKSEFFLKVEMIIKKEKELDSFNPRIIEYAKKIDEGEYINILKNNSNFDVVKKFISYDDDELIFSFLSLLAIKVSLKGSTSIKNNVLKESIRIFNINNNTLFSPKDIPEKFFKRGDNGWSFLDKTIQSTLCAIFLVENLENRNLYFNGFKNASEIAYLNESFDLIHNSNAKISKEIIDFFESPMIMNKKKRENYVRDWVPFFETESLTKTLMIINREFMEKGELVFPYALVDKISLDFIRSLMNIPLDDYLKRGLRNIAHTFGYRIAANPKSFNNTLKRVTNCPSQEKILKYFGTVKAFRSIYFPFISSYNLKKTQLYDFAFNGEKYSGVGTHIIEYAKIANVNYLKYLRWFIKDSEINPPEFFYSNKQNIAIEAKIKKDWILKNDDSENFGWIKSYIESGEFSAKEVIEIMEGKTDLERSYLKSEIVFPEELKIKFNKNEYNDIYKQRYNFLFTEKEDKKDIEICPRDIPNDKLEYKTFFQNNLKRIIIKGHRGVRFLNDFKKKRIGLDSFLKIMSKDLGEKILKEEKGYQWNDWYIDYVMQLLQEYNGTKSMIYNKKILKVALLRYSEGVSHSEKEQSFILNKWYINYIEKFSTKENLLDLISDINEKNILENEKFWFLYSNENRDEIIKLLKIKDEKAYIKFLSHAIEHDYSVGDITSNLKSIDIDNEIIKNSIKKNSLQKIKKSEIYPDRLIFVLKNRNIFSKNEIKKFDDFLEKILSDGMKNIAGFEGGRVPFASEYWGRGSSINSNLVDFINEGLVKLDDEIIINFKKCLEIGKHKIIRVGIEILQMVRRNDVMHGTKLEQKFCELKSEFLEEIELIIEQVDGDSTNYGSMEFGIAKYYSYLNNDISEQEFIVTTNEIIKNIKIICKENISLKEKELQNIIHSKMINKVFSEFGFVWHREFDPFLKRKIGWIDFSVSYNSMFAVVELKRITDPRLSNGEYKDQMIKYDNNYKKILSKTLLIYGVGTKNEKNKAKRIEKYISTIDFDIECVWN